MSYTAIASQTLGSSASSVTFSSIPGTFRDLVLVADAGASGSTYLGMRLNGDTGSNYPQVTMSGNGSQTSSQSATRTNIGEMGLDWGLTASTRANHIFQIMDYSVTDKHKSVLHRRNNDGIEVLALAARWANTSAVTSITLLTIGGAAQTFNAGSTFSLYGVSA